MVPTAGSPLSASLFLRPVGSRVEHLGDRLNEPGAFFVPAEINDHSELLRLSWVAYLEHKSVLPEVKELEEMAATREPALVTLFDGSILEGDLLYVLPPERSRISDLLNNPSHRFLLMVDGETTRYVNCASIARLRPTRS